MDKRVETLKAHPAAEAYRMMTEDELGELSESIRANGLRDPITVGVIAKERWIVDGRNREKACEIAGVAREYEEIEFENEDALRAFVLDRNERRSITAGQKAMGHALLFPKPPTAQERGAKGGKGNKAVQPLNGFSKALLSQARIIVNYSVSLGESVRDGSLTISQALTKADTEKKLAQSMAARIAVLRENAADLAALVDEEKMTVSEAEAAFQTREKEKRQREEEDKQHLLRAAAETSGGLLVWSDEAMAKLNTLMEDEVFAGLLRQSLRGKAELLDRMAAGAEAFLAFLKEEFRS